MNKIWSDLTPEQKREERFKRWLSPTDVKFSSPEAEKACIERMMRFARALHLSEPDRVPVTLSVGNFPAYYAGGSLRTNMYNYGELVRSWTKFLHDFASDMDSFDGPGLGHSGRVLDLLGYKLYKWPGHGLGPEVSHYQFVDNEYMMADEYDKLMKDPTGFALRVLLPRVMTNLQPLQRLPSFVSLVNAPIRLVAPAVMPDFQASLLSLRDAGKEMAKWQEAIGIFNREAEAMGFRSMMTGGAIAPFDAIGNMLRGTRGIMMDMYRQPDKLKEAMEMIADLTIEETISSMNNTSGVMVGFAMHKGGDSFMSLEQFETFYWPTLKKIVLALINEGIMVALHAEGYYNKRLDIVKDLPRGWIMWALEHTDIFKAKEVLGGSACISGNVPTSLMCTGTPQRVKEHCRKLIEVCGQGGGYILSAAGSATEAKPANLRAMMEAVREYGTY